MRLVSVTRIFNEDDIVESFVRHHSTVVDHMIFLDDGSIDRTLEILDCLRDDGFPITVISNTTAYYDEVNKNTWLYRYAVETHNAVWVLFLDTDEFLDERAASYSLRELLERAPDDLASVKLQLINYTDTKLDDTKQIPATRRITWRTQEPIGVFKVCVKAYYPVTSVIIDAGNHELYIADYCMQTLFEEKILLAHYVRRSAWQEISKSVIGRLKVLAAGSVEVSKNRSSHYNSPFQLLRDVPNEFLHLDTYFNIDPIASGLINDPTYFGDQLIYTNLINYKMKAISLIISYVEKLAIAHGELLETISQESDGIQISKIEIL